MTLQRKNPLPPGRYWQDIFARQANDWNAWLAPVLRSGDVTIERVEHFNADPLHDGSWLPGGASGDLNVIGDRTWVLFNVVNPVDWPATKLGFPTIAEKEVQSSADTATNPPGPTVAEEIAEAAANAAKKAADDLKPLLWGAFAVGLVYLFRKEIFK